MSERLTSTRADDPGSPLETLILIRARRSELAKARDEHSRALQQINQMDAELEIAQHVFVGLELDQQNPLPPAHNTGADARGDGG